MMASETMDIPQVRTPNLRLIASDRPISPMSELAAPTATFPIARFSRLDELCRSGSAGKVITFPGSVQDLAPECSGCGPGIEPRRRGFGWITRFPGLLWQGCQDANRHRHARHALRNLSEHQLRDIGLTRWQRDEILGQIW